MVRFARRNRMQVQPSTSRMSMSGSRGIRFLSGRLDICTYTIIRALENAEIRRGVPISLANKSKGKERPLTKLSVYAIKLHVYKDNKQGRNTMDFTALLGLSILLSFFASARVAQLYVWPWLRSLPREQALNALVAPHLFRFIGLSFLMPGVVSPAMPHSFAL